MKTGVAATPATLTVARLSLLLPLFYLTLSSGLPPPPLPYAPPRLRSPPGTGTADDGSGTMESQPQLHLQQEKALVVLLLYKPTTTTTTVDESSKKQTHVGVSQLINANNTATKEADSSFVPRASVPPSTNAITTNVNVNRRLRPTNDGIITTTTHESNVNHDHDHYHEDTQHTSMTSPPPSSNFGLPNENLISHTSHGHDGHHYENLHDSSMPVSVNSATSTKTKIAGAHGADANLESGAPAAPAKKAVQRRIRAAIMSMEGEKDERDTHTHTEKRGPRDVKVEGSLDGSMTGILNTASTADSDTLVSSTQSTAPRPKKLQHVYEPASGKNNRDEELHNHNLLPPLALPLVQNYTAKVPLRGSCNATFRCAGDFVECSRGHCRCQDGYAPSHDERDVCRDLPIYNLDLPQTDPTMIGVIIGLILMSFTLCIVLRLFAKARFRENRTIFNTPNPRLMNVSLLKGGKQLLRGNSGGNIPSRSRRGSQTSIQSAVAAEAHQHNQSHGHSHSQNNSPPKVLSPTSPQNEAQTQGMGGHPRPKTLRQASTDNETPGVSRGAAAAKSKYRQDSVSSNV